MPRTTATTTSATSSQNIKQQLQQPKSQQQQQLKHSNQYDRQQQQQQQQQQANQQTSTFSSLQNPLDTLLDELQTFSRPALAAAAAAAAAAEKKSKMQAGGPGAGPSSSKSTSQEMLARLTTTASSCGGSGSSTIIHQSGCGVGGALSIMENKTKAPLALPSSSLSRAVVLPPYAMEQHAEAATAVDSRKKPMDNLEVDNNSRSIRNNKQIVASNEHLSYRKTQLDNSNVHHRREDSRSMHESLSPSGLELGASAASIAALKFSSGIDPQNLMTNSIGRNVSSYSRQALQQQHVPNSLTIRDEASKLNSFSSCNISLGGSEDKLFRPLSAEMLLGHGRPPAITDHILSYPKPMSATDFSHRQTFNFDPSMTGREEKLARRLSLTDVEFQMSQSGGIAALESTRNLSEQISKSKNNSARSISRSPAPLSNFGTNTLPKILPSHQLGKENKQVLRAHKPIPPPLSTPQNFPLLSVQQPLFTAIPPTPTTTINSPTPITPKELLPPLTGIDSLKVGDLPGTLSSTGFLGAGVIIRDGIIVRRLPSFPSSDSQASTSPVKGPSPPLTPIKMCTPPHTPRTRQRFNMPTSFSTSSEGRDSPLLPPRHNPHRLPPPPPPRNSSGKSPATSPKSRSPSYRKSRSPTKNTFQYPSPQSISPVKSYPTPQMDNFFPQQVDSLIQFPDSYKNYHQVLCRSSQKTNPGGGGGVGVVGGLVTSVVDGVPMNAEGRQLYGPVLKQRPPLPRSSFSEDSTTSTVSSTSAPDTSISSSGGVGGVHMRGIDSRPVWSRGGLGKNLAGSRTDKISSNSSSTESINSQEPLSSRRSNNDKSISELQTTIEMKTSAGGLTCTSPLQQRKENKASVKEYTDVLQQLSSNFNKGKKNRVEKKSIDQERAGSAPPLSVRPNTEAKQKQELLEQRHIELLRRQKQLQEQYERLQTMQKTGCRLSAPNMDTLKKELLDRESPQNESSRPTIRIRRATLKKTGSENNLLNRPGLSIAPAEAGGSLTNLLTVNSPQMATKRPHSQPTSSISVINSTNVDKPSSPTSISTMNWSEASRPSFSDSQNISKTIVVGANYSSTPTSPSSSVNNPFRPANSVRTTTVTTKILGGNLTPSRKIYKSSPTSSPTPSSTSTPTTVKKSSISITLQANKTSDTTCSMAMDSYSSK